MASGKSLLLSLKNVRETLATSTVTVVDAVRGTLTKEACDERLEAWASRVVANSEMMISVHGREHYDPKATYVVMSNHQSHYDVAVIYYVLGARIRMVAKRELFNLPVFGSAMKAAGFISVDRGNNRSAIASLAEARTALEHGTPIWIAPEGTRSPTGELLPFKKGGFVLAVEAGVPVLPVSIAGTREVLRAKGMLSRSGVEVFVTIHPPVDPRRWADKEPKAARDALSAEVRASIASGL
ncbi:MAG: 1-acyl-sn-glycerol-3-phosphate acyltransferase [Labilithrix sp.]|nr:1-acyl-sn-glycerol-3-phosphate acyltransferase [Labilithrix sp.]MCW5816861.1 1-acyl-sn-glycerol-3-phosphate acyltransferase [Labilithrix sp.]